MISMELLTMMGGAGAGFFSQLIANAQKDRHEQFKMLTKSHELAEKSVKGAREFDTKSSNWVRRFIVLASYIMAAFLIIAGLFVQTNIITEVPSSSFLGLFEYGGGTKVLTLTGLVAFPWLTTSILAIVSFYFGQKPAKR